MKENEVSLRKFPYPYRAALAICNDIDQTANIEEFLEIQRFLNTEGSTQFGKGLGLEVGNSLFLDSKYHPDKQLSFSSSPKSKEMLLRFVKAKIIDSFHSYSDSKIEMSEIQKFLSLLKDENCGITVWIDHNHSGYNLGKHSTHGKGDLRNSEYYHADLTLSYGVRFAWMGEVTSIIGQATSLTPKKIVQMLDIRHPSSIITAVKHIGKVVLGFLGFDRFLSYYSNDLVRVRTLYDGHKIYEFVRCNPHWRGPGFCANPRSFPYVFSRQNLERLIRSEGYMILYTHLGEKEESDGPLPMDGWNSLRNVAKMTKNGNLFVSTTSRLLQYHVRHKYLDWSWNISNANDLIITLNAIRDPICGIYIPTRNNIQGFTFYVPSDVRTRLFVGKKRIKIRENPPDYTGRKSLSVPIYPTFSHEIFGGLLE